MIRSLYNWTLRLANHRHALWALAAVSFIESSLFPIPPDVLLIPMILAARPKAWRIAGVCTLASVIGGLFGYAIGHFVYNKLGQPIMEMYGYTDLFSSFQDRYNAWGIWLVVMAGFTPFPYKVITIASGVFGLNLGTFILASIISRGGRFFLIAALLWRFGTPIQTFIEKNLGWIATVFFGFAISGFLAVKYVL